MKHRSYRLFLLLALFTSLLGSAVRLTPAHAGEVDHGSVYRPLAASIPGSWSSLGTIPLSGEVRTIAVSGTDVYAGGLFTDAGGDANADYIAKFDTTTNTWSVLGTGLNDLVQAIAISGTNVYAGGEFTNAGGDVFADYIAKFSTTSNIWSSLGTIPLSGEVRTIAVSGTDVYAGGWFSNAGGGANADYIAKFDTTTNTWSALGTTPLNNVVHAIAISGTDVYAGGNFTNAGGDANADGIAKFDTTTSTWSALGPGLNSYVSAIAISGTDVYAGGNFTNAGGDANADYIAKFDTTTNTWSALGTTPLNNVVHAIATSGTDVYAGGLFTDAGGDANADYIARFDTTIPTVISHTLLSNYTSGPSSFTVTFSETVDDSGSGALTDDVTNINNYKIINKGANGTVETATCASPLSGDDSLVLPSVVTYLDPTATVNLGGPLPNGKYRIFICGTTSIVDLAGNALAGDGVTSGTDFTFDFTVGTTSAALPDTGFAPNRITSLPTQSASYTNLNSIWLEIPKLNVKSEIVGVPQSANGWNVDWLGNSIGWLNGTAFPSWEGNSVITGHVYDANGLPGPFQKIKNLKSGDQVIVHMFGEKYIFEVRESEMVFPSKTSYALQHLEGYSYLTLITCQWYNPITDSYAFRRIVRAALVSVGGE